MRGDSDASSSTPSSQQVAFEDASDALGHAEQAAKEERHKRTLRGGHDPAELARRRWAKHRERQQEDDKQTAYEARDQAVVVRVPVQIGAIIQALAKAAQRGGVAEARELRAYLAEYPVESDTDVGALDRRTRQALLAALLDDRLMQIYEEGRLEEVLAAACADDAGSQ
jgi:hypothetical protein